jgi:hypothetical protein
MLHIGVIETPRPPPMDMDFSGQNAIRRSLQPHSTLPNITIWRKNKLCLLELFKIPQKIYQTIWSQIEEAFTCLNL